MKRREIFLMYVYSAIKKRTASLYMNNTNLRPMPDTGFTLEITAWPVAQDCKGVYTALPDTNFPGFTMAGIRTSKIKLCLGMSLQAAVIYT